MKHTTSAWHGIIVLVAVSIMACSQPTADQKPLETPLVENTPFSYPSISEMVGAMLITGINGTEFNPKSEVAAALKEGKIGGIIYYEKNLAKSNTEKFLSQFSNDIISSSKIAPFIGIDQEGGKVNRLKTKYGFPKSVTMGYLGTMNNKDSTAKYATSTALTLKKLGINVNFAPCVDLCSNPDNPIIGKYERCFSKNPEIVSNHAGIFINHHNQNKVISVIKHFPGHGSSGGDTHKEMVDVTSLWKDSELAPYKTLIAGGTVPAVMTAHIVNKKLEPAGLPSTLSAKTINHLLRDSLNFKGVVFSDDLHMRAIATHYGIKQAVLLSINAGVDMLMFSGNIEGVTDNGINQIHQTILNLVNNGEISEERIKESYQRIYKLKQKFEIL